MCIPAHAERKQGEGWQASLSFCRYEILTPNSIPKGFMDGKQACVLMVSLAPALLDLSDERLWLGCCQCFGAGSARCPSGSPPSLWTVRASQQTGL